MARLTLGEIRAGKAALLGALAAWYARPALLDQCHGLPLNPREIALARSLDRQGRAVLTSIDGRPCLQPVAE